MIIPSYNDIKQLKINNPSMINIILGENGIGKTTILQSIKESSPNSVLFFDEKTVIDHIGTNWNNEDVLSAIKTLIPDIEYLTKNEYGILHIKTKNQLLPSNSFSRSLRKILLLISFLFSASEQKILLVDDIDDCFTEDTMATIWLIIFSFLKKVNCNIYCTCTTVDCVKSLIKSIGNNDEICEFSYYRIQENYDGRLGIVHYNKSEIKLAIENHIDIT